MGKSNSKKNNIIVIGLGYVGLTLAAKLAQKTKVYGVEKNLKVLNQIKKRKAHFFETGINEILNDVITSKSLSVFQSIDECPNPNTNSIFIITVGTPNSQIDNLTSIFSNLLSELNHKVRDGDTFILRSTVSIGTCDLINNWFIQHNKQVNVCFCPERTVEGRAIEELSELPQIISSNSKKGLNTSKKLFELIGAETIIASNFKTAELAKLTSNIERDVYFGFANQINFISKYHGVSFGELRNLVTYKYSRSHLKHTAPVGGPCLEKDTYILKKTMPGVNHLTTIIDAARKFNESWAKNVLDFLEEIITSNQIKSICITGLSFKATPLTDDLRGTLSLGLFKKIRKKGIPVFLYDRHVKTLDIKNFFSVDSETILESLEMIKDESTLILVQNGSMYAIEELISKNLTFLDMTSFHFGQIDDKFIM